MSLRHNVRHLKVNVKCQCKTLKSPKSEFIQTGNTYMRRSNIGLAGCGMGHKIEAGCGIREISRARNALNDKAYSGPLTYPVSFEMPKKKT